MSTIPKIAAAVVALALSLGAAACGGGSGGTGSDAASAGPAPTRVEFDPANFVDPTTRHQPVPPAQAGHAVGPRRDHRGRFAAVPHEIITTMTDVIRIIDGVHDDRDARRVHRLRRGVPGGIDYFALDKDGNVWILGGYTEEYEGGAFTNTEERLSSAPAGAPSSGSSSPADVDMGHPRWFIGKAPDEAASIGQPVRIGIRECVTFGCFDDVRVVMEGDIGAPDNENKYYAPGVGVIRNVPLRRQPAPGHVRADELRRAEPRGTGRGAARPCSTSRTTPGRSAKDVFGSAPPAQRAP